MPQKSPASKNKFNDYDIQITLDSEGCHKIQILGIDDSGNQMILKQGLDVPKSINIQETYGSPEKKKDLFSKETIGAFLAGFLLGGSVVYFVGSSKDSSYANRIKELEKMNQILQRKVTATPQPQYYGYQPQQPPPQQQYQQYPSEERFQSNLIKSYEKFDSGLDLYGKKGIY